MAIAELVIDFAANLARFQADLNKVKQQGEDLQKTLSQQFNHVQGAIDSVGSSIKSVTGFIGAMSAALAGGAAFKSMISATTQWTGEVVSLSKALGMSTQQASGFNVMLRTVGIESDSVKTATQRLAMSINKDGGSAIENLGVKVKDSNGHLRSSTDIMLDVNEKLSGMKAGIDRNAAAASVYGKGWMGISDILKATRSEFDAGIEKAEKLGLTIGGQEAENVKKYKREMNELKLQITALEVAIGTALIPTLTSLGKGFLETGDKAISPFVQHIHDIQAELIRLAMLTDKAGGSMTRLGYAVTGGSFTSLGRWFGEQNKMYAERYNQGDKALQAIVNSEMGLDANGNPIPKTGGQSGNNYDPGKASSVTAATDKFRQYQDAINGVAVHIRDLNPLLVESEKENLRIDDAVGKLLGKFPEHASQIQILGDAWKRAATELRDYNAGAEARKRAAELDAVYGEQHMALDKTASGLGQFKYSPKAEKPSVLGKFDLFNNNAEYEKMMKERAQIQERYDAIILNSQMNIANTGLEMIKRSVKEGSAVYIAAGIAQKALAVAQIIMQTNVAANAALMPPPIGLGPIAGQGLYAEITALGYTNAAMVGAMGIMDAMQGRALGGPAYAGSSYLVGEQGPEIITMGANGFVTPNHALPAGGASSAVTQHITIDARGADQGVEQRIQVAMKQAKEQAKAEILNSMNRGGSFALASGRLR